MLWKQVFSRLVLPVSLACAEVHNLFVGNLGNPAKLYSLEFDDEALSLRIAREMTADAPHAWIAFDHSRKNLYGASLRKSSIASYTVVNGTSLRLTKSVTATKNCNNKTSAFVIARNSAPYTVYSAAWPGPNACGMSLGVQSDGSLDQVLDSWLYDNNSGVHGLAFGGEEQSLLYSADLNGDTIWTHTILDGGQVKKAASWKLPKSGAHPRHLVAHPAGKSLYVVMEAANTLVSFNLDDKGFVSSEASSYSLIPSDQKPADYWSAEVMLSATKRYLWATARAQESTNLPGYLSCFLVDDLGQIRKRMFMVPTTTTAGIANAISPAPWSDEWAAMTDYHNGYVQVWKMENKTETTNGTEFRTAKAVAKVDIRDGGCCANVIWYS